MNITQPILSRQLAAFEEELGTALFIRESRSITLTEAGILLKQRVLEIIDLEEKILDELTVKEGLIEGTITIGCGKFAAVETLAEISFCVAVTADSGKPPIQKEWWCRTCSEI